MYMPNAVPSAAVVDLFPPVTLDELATVINTLYSDYDASRGQEGLELLERARTGTATWLEVLDDAYSRYPGALRNILQIGLWRYCPAGLTDVNGILAAHPTFSAMFRYLREHYDVALGTWLPSQDAAMRALVRCREAVLAHTLAPTQHVDIKGIVDSVTSACGALSEDDLVAKVVAMSSSPGSDARAAFWYFVFRTDVTALGCIEGLLKRYDGDVPACEDDFRTTLRQRCVRTQLTATLRKAGTPPLLAEDQALRALRSCNPADCGTLLQYVGVNSPISIVQSVSDTPSRILATPERDTRPFQPQATSTIGSAKRYGVSPSPPFASSVSGILNVAPPPMHTAQRADFYDPSSDTAAHLDGNGTPKPLVNREHSVHTAPPVTPEARPASPAPDRAARTHIQPVTPQEARSSLPRLPDDDQLTNERLELDQLRRVLHASSMALKEQEANLKARTELVELRHAEVMSKLERTPDQRAIIQAAHEQLRLREADIEACQASLTEQQRQLQEEKMSIEGRIATCAERERAIEAETDDMMNRIESHALRLKEAERLVLARELKVETREREVKRREDSVQEAEVRVQRQQQLLTDRLKLVEQEANDIAQRAAELNSKADWIADTVEKMRLREDAMWRVSAMAASHGSTTPKSIAEIRESLLKTRRSLQAIPASAPPAPAVRSP